MRSTRLMRWCAALLAGTCAITVPVSESKAQWPQWGGPNRDFKIETSGLADSWPSGGPKKLWHRELGDGYSSIIVDDGFLYTMYRKGRTEAHEYTIALDAQTGKTIWEHAHRSPLMSQDDSGWGGLGPNATPLTVGDRLYTVGSRAMLHCFEKRTGRVVWEKDLATTLGAPVSQTTGYSPSPIAYGDTLILAVGCPRAERSNVSAESRGQALVAFNQATGDVAWKALDFEMGFSSPIMIRFSGQGQLVCATRSGLIGVDPAAGRLLWRHSKAGSIVTPVWNGSDMLFYSSGGDDAVGLAVKLSRKGGETVPEELWVNKKIGIWQPTPVQVNDCLYGSTSQLMLGVNMRTGERVWAKRGYPMAGCVLGDGKLIILDQNGKLTLATGTPEGLTVHSQCQVTEKYSFTAPTLVGKTLYVRDRKHIMAFDLG